MTVLPFNLVDQPWIPVVLAGRPERLSLRELAERPDAVDALDVAEPLSAVAVLRQVLLPVWLDALGLPADSDAWRDRWEHPRTGSVQVLDYLDEHRGRFDLFDGEVPFAQVAGLRTARDETKPVSVLLPDQPTGNNVPLFGGRTEADPPPLRPADAALALLVAHCLDTAGIKSGAVGDPRVAAGKTTGNPTGPVGQLGLLVPLGASVGETLALNSPLAGAVPSLTLGRPQWRRPPLSPAWEEREAGGLLDLLTWQSRRVRLVPDPDPDPEPGSGQVVVRRVVLAAGDRLRAVPEFEPHTGWQQDRTPRAGGSPQRPMRHRSGRSVWQGMQALLATRAPTSDGKSSSLLLAQLTDLRAEDVIPADLRLNVLAAQVVYGTQSAVVEDVFTDLLPLPVAALPDDSPVRDLLVTVAAHAAQLQQAANRLENALREAAGGDGLPWDRGQRLGDTLVQDLTPVVRRLLAGVQCDPARVEAADAAWRQVARGRAVQAAETVLTAAPAATFAGRVVTRNGRDWPVRLSSAEAAFRRALTETLGPVPTWNGER